jgi:hypothetical protein
VQTNAQRPFKLLFGTLCLCLVHFCHILLSFPRARRCVPLVSPLVPFFQEPIVARTFDESELPLTRPRFPSRFFFRDPPHLLVGKQCGPRRLFLCVRGEDVCHHSWGTVRQIQWGGGGLPVWKRCVAKHPSQLVCIIWLQIVGLAKSKVVDESLPV